MKEIDEYTLLNPDKVYVDTRYGVLNECGVMDIIIARRIYEKALEKGIG